MSACLSLEIGKYIGTLFLFWDDLHSLLVNPILRRSINLLALIISKGVELEKREGS